MENKITIVFIFLLLALSTSVKGQLSCNAGNDTVLCALDTSVGFQLGSSPTAWGGMGNYYYDWEYEYHYVFQGDTLFSYDESDCLTDSAAPNPLLISQIANPMELFVTVTDDSGNVCRDSVTIQFSEITDDLSYYTVYIEPGDTVQIWGGLTSNITPVEHQWSPEYNIGDPNAQSTFVYPDTSTIYDYMITDAAGCTAVQKARFHIIIGTESIELVKQPTLQVFPNPFTDHLEVYTKEKNVTITLYGSDGAKQSIQIFDSGNVKYIDTHALPKGTYYLQVVHGASRLTKLLLK